MGIVSFLFDVQQFLSLGPSNTTWFLIGMVLFLVAALSLIFGKEYEKKQLSSELNTLKAGRPSLKFRDVVTRQAPLINPITREQTGAPFFSTIQFVNEPLQPSESATAKKITATVTFFNAERQKLFSMYGRWSDTPEIARIGMLTADMHEIDIPPFSYPRRLDVVLKYDGTHCCHAYNNESVVKDPRLWRDPAKELLPGRFIFSVKLGGENYLGTFWFSLVNHENKGNVDIQYLENYDATSF